MRLASLPLAALFTSLSCLPAHAGEIYAGIGLPGLIVGYAHPVSTDFTLRGDFATLGQRSKTTNEEGIDYQAKLKANRAALLADWFVAGGFRLTGGVTFNQMKIDLLAQGAGRTINLGGTNYTLGADDQLRVKIEFPRTTPYFGIGYGHQRSEGLGFTFDLGASFGKAKITETHTGTVLSNASQADIDRELAELRDGVGKVRFIPQLSIGMAVRF